MSLNISLSHWKSHWIMRFGRRYPVTDVTQLSYPFLHLYFSKWQKTFERLKVRRIPFVLLPHRFSPSVSSGHWSFDACRSSFVFSAISEIASRQTLAIWLCSLSVNTHISSYNILRIVSLTLLIQHTKDPQAGLNKIKSSYTLLFGVPTERRNLFTISSHHICWSCSGPSDSTE